MVQGGKPVPVPGCLHELVAAVAGGPNYVTHLPDSLRRSYATGCVHFCALTRQDPTGLMAASIYRNPGSRYLHGGSGPGERHVCSEGRYRRSSLIVVGEDAYPDVLLRRDEHRQVEPSPGGSGRSRRRIVGSERTPPSSTTRSGKIIGRRSRTCSPAQRKQWSFYRKWRAPAGETGDAAAVDDPDRFPAHQSLSEEHEYKTVN